MEEENSRQVLFEIKILFFLKTFQLMFKNIMTSPVQSILYTEKNLQFAAFPIYQSWPHKNQMIHLLQSQAPGILIRERREAKYNYSLSEVL